jgi:2-octaprenyl-6-methoxyphenol hydroxylase
MIHSFDIAISGAGPMGLMLAFGLARQSMSVALIEKREPQKNINACRSFALSYANTHVFKNLGLSLPFDMPIEQISVSKQHTRQGLHYRASDMGVPALGFMIPESTLAKALDDVTQNHPHIHHFRPNEVIGYQEHASHLALTLKSGDTLMAKLMICADGKHSPMRQDISPKNLSWPYEQSALCFTVKHTKPHKQRAFEHFTDVGPLAFLPLKKDQSAVIWSLKNDLADQLMHNPHTLLHALINHFGWGLGDFTLTSRIAAYPLSLELPWTQNQNRRLLIGDAAHTIHPVAGQGLNLGIRDVFALINHIQEQRELGLDIGLNLKNYTQKRRFDHRSMAFVTHGLVWGLEKKWTTPIWRWGARAINLFPLLKTPLVRHAMGFGIDPDLDALCHFDGQTGPKTREQHPSL